MANEKRLIDANALSESVSGIGKDIKRPRVVELACLCLIAEAPTVDAVEVVHGQWLFDSGRERCFCSVCNETALYTSKDEPIFDYDWEENLRYSHTETIIEEHLTNYCPNCGAKMDGDGNA